MIQFHSKHPPIQWAEIDLDLDSDLSGVMRREIGRDNRIYPGYPRLRSPRKRKSRFSGLKICLNCGKWFKCPPSDKTVTCSTSCSSRHRRRKHYGKRNRWCDQSRQMLSERGQTANLKLGTPAAQLSPKSGPFETNQNAKAWIVISPHGEPYEVRNLALWCRENESLFGPDSARTAYAGLRQVKAWLMGRKKRMVSQWKGWSLAIPD